MTLIQDFDEEMKQQILVQPFIRSDGYKDLYGEGTNYPAIVSYSAQDITKADGSTAVSTMQIAFDGSVVITDKDKITFGTVSPKILKIHPAYDSEFPDEIYEVIVYT